MNLAAPRLLDGYPFALGIGFLIAILAPTNPLMAAGFVAAMLFAFSLAAPTGAWVGATLLLAIGGRALVPVGVPESVALGVLPLAWVALGLAVCRYRGSVASGGLMVGLLALVTVAMVSGVVNGVSPLRSLFYLALLASPFALIGAIAFDPPDELWRKRLTNLLIGLIVLQIPFALWQTYTFGISDFVQGTFIDSKVGAHTTAAISLLGAIWLALRGPLTPLRIVVVLLLVMIPLLAAANQVIFALPLALVAVAVVSDRRLAIAASLGIGLTLALLLLPGWNSDYARSSVDRLSSALKAEPAAVVAEGAVQSPGAALAGQGPAMTVSHAAFLTTEQNSVLAALGLEAAEIPKSFNLRVIDESLSIKRPESSLLGIIGDLGLLGALAYALLFAYMFNQCRIRPNATAQTAAVALAMAFILGYISDWLEQPGFTLFVAALVGLALTAADDDQTGLDRAR